MKRLCCLLLISLAGCPNWDAERERRCRELDAGTGICDRGTDAGGGGSGGGSGDTGDAGVVETYAAFTPVVRRTYGNAGRVPIFVWENRTGATAVVVEEKFPVGFSIWREGDQAAAGNLDMYNVCGPVAANDFSTHVGTSFTNGSQVFVNIDDVDAGNVIGRDAPLTRCPTALSAYLRADAGVAFLAVSHVSSMLRVERTTCMGCPQESVEIGRVFMGAVGEAVTDSSQTTWLSGVDTQGSAVAWQLPPESVLSASQQVSGGVPTSTRVHLSTSGTRIHAAWVNGTQLSVVEVFADGGASASPAIQLGYAARLVDLVEGPRTVVAVLDYEGRTALYVRDEGGAGQFVRVATSFDFQARVAHLGSKLRLVGLCDGGCMANPLLEFERLPDGGNW